MIYSIYIITNIVNAKQYVGITKRLNKRWYEHQRIFDAKKMIKKVSEVIL